MLLISSRTSPYHDWSFITSVSEFYRCINGLPAPVIAPVNTRKSETNSSNRLMGLTQPKPETRNPSVAYEQNPAVSAIRDTYINYCEFQLCIGFWSPRICIMLW